MRRSATPWRAIAALAMLCAAGTGAAAADPPRAPPRAILLFVASWCAPCYGELRALDAITRAAAPFRVLVVPIDARRGTRRMMAGVPADQRLALDPAAATALMRRLSGGAAGLPTSIAIDRRGATCGVVRRPLSALAAAAMRARCEESPPIG